MAFVGAALAWTFHLLASYALVGVGCMTGWSGAGRSVMVVTVACVAAAGGAGVLAYRQWRVQRRRAPSDGAGSALAGSRELLMLVGALSAPLFIAIIITAGLTVSALPLCP